MKTSILKSVLFLFAIVLFSPACEITVDDDNPISSSMDLNEMETFGWVYSEIQFNGSGFDTNCSNVSVVLSSGGTSQEIEVQTCTENSIVAWIPDTMEPGMYDVTLNVGGNSFTSIGGNDLQVEVKIRPVILTMSPTAVAPGGTVNLTGKYILNETNTPQYDPQVWLMATGYTNTVSDITVNAEGTEATVVISDNIAPGEYTFKLSCVEWSNELVITIL